MSLSFGSKFIRHSNAVAAGTSTITPSAGVPIDGHESCTFLVCWGAIVASGVQSIEVHQSSDDGVGDAYSALLGTNISVADSDDNKITVVEVVRPIKRYLKCIINRATQNSTLDSIVAILGAASDQPVTADTTESGRELHVSPSEGTA